jgi:hypothetical protein
LVGSGLEGVVTKRGATTNRRQNRYYDGNRQQPMRAQSAPPGPSHPRHSIRRIYGLRAV